MKFAKVQVLIDFLSQDRHAKADTNPNRGLLLAPDSPILS